jgi:LuxR family maltose regulon positive regulatory protein
MAKRSALGKITRPSLPDILPRRRLFARLDEGRKGPAVWVTGPPGSGKTTLVASYFDHAAIPCIWYQLDEGDADVATFFYFLGQAAAELVEGGPLPLLTPEHHGGLGAFTRGYFQTLYARLRPPFAVVFDGYHEVPASSPFHEVMREALGGLPAGGCVMLLSRGDPPPGLARLRANRALAVLGWEELRLTQQETRAIVRQRHPRLAERELEELYGRTQGWAAGLVLMLEQARRGGSLAAPPDLATRQLLFDYLAGEIFQKSDARTQEFLLRTAYPTQLTVALAEAVSGEREAGGILSELHRNNYFVSLHETGRDATYRYHPMFRDFLLARAQDSMSREQRRALQRVCAEQYEAAGQIEEAITLYRESRDWNEVARLFGQHGAAMLAQGRGETLVRWLEELPPETQRDHPWCVYWAASSYMPAVPREARLLFERAFELFRQRDEREGVLRAACGVIDAILYELDDFSLLDRWIGVLDAGADTPFASKAVEARVACSMLIAFTVRQPQRHDMRQWMERAFACSQDDPDPNLRMYVGLFAAHAYAWTGLYEKAHGIIEAMRRVAEGAGVSPFSQITLKHIETLYYMLAAEREPCLKAMREGLQLARATGVHTWTFQTLVYGYGGALGDQDLVSAARVRKELEAQAASAPRFSLACFRHFAAWEAMLSKDLMRALQEERTALRMAVEVGCPYFEALCRMGLARILADCGDERKCVAQLQQVRAIVEAIDNRHLEYSCLTLFAGIALEHGRERAGLNALRRAFALGREYGYSHFQWWLPADVAKVCVRALEADIEVEYARDLVRRRRLSPAGAAPAPGGWPWAFRVSTLGSFALLRHGEPMAASGKAQRRPLELLKVLISLGGEGVGEELITDAIWPRIPGDSAHRSFTSALHRLRKLLGEDKALVLHEGKLSLDRRYVWTDVWAFEAQASELEGALAQSTTPVDAAVVTQAAQRLLDLYRGPFLATEADAPWTLPRRERLRSQFARSMTELGRYWESRGEPQRAIEGYERCLELDPLAESFYRQLMICLHRLDRPAEALEIFQRCRKALQAGLGAQPSAETNALYEKLFSSRPRPAAASLSNP